MCFKEPLKWLEEFGFLGQRWQWGIIFDNYYKEDLQIL